MGHSWSHDILGAASADDGAAELFSRWLQTGAFSGIMRTHDRGNSAGGGCVAEKAAGGTFNCSVVEPWTCVC